MQEKYRLESLQAALQVLELFLESPKVQLGVSEIGRQLDLGKSQVYRILQNLAEYGYISRDPETRQYQLGLKFLLAGRMVSERLDLLHVANPVLDQLWEQTGETVHLVLKTKQGPLCVAERQSVHRLRFFAAVGMRLPWHAGTASKILLAHLPRKQQEEILSGDLEAYTPNTPTEPDELRNDLRQILAAGYATSYGEMTIGARAIGAPIRDYHGSVIATISVVGPSQRLDEQKIDEYTTLVIDAARRVSERLGYLERSDDSKA